MIMLPYALLAGSLLGEFLLVFVARKKSLWLILLAGVTLVITGFAASSLVGLQPSVATVSLALVSLARIVNVLRIVEGRLKNNELRRRSRRTFAALAASSIVLASYGLWFDENFAISVRWLLFVQLGVSVLLAASVLLARTIYRYRPARTLPDALPTVTVCIPARNETADLPACIESVLASTYQKLEIIVLDDCSHDKTPDIIKRYAHAGVRFVNGKEPRDDWLAKNAAYDRLADEATGDVLVFIGVDVRLQPESIRELIAQLDGNDMISVLPYRSSTSEQTIFLQPLRYWWELGLWRFSLQNPPVLSSCWAIRASALKKLGTFESVKKAIEPEAVFARSLAKKKQYGFLVANETVGVTSIKAPRQQFQTALRKRYPQMRRRPETALMVMLFELVFVLSPFVLAAWFIVQNAAAEAILALAASLIIAAANAEVYKLALRRFWPVGFFSVPFLVIADWVLLIRSLYAYEFGKVIWKERNICLPLFQIDSSLPKL